MKLFIDGEKSRAICNHCKDIVSVTFVRRDVPFSDRKGAAQDILVGVCDVCDQVVSIPAQSTPAISESRKKALKSIEVRLPAIYLDVLDLAAFTLEPESTPEFRKDLVCYYIHDLAQDPNRLERVFSAHKLSVVNFSSKKSKIPSKRLSMKVSGKLKAELQRLEVETELSTTDLLKSVVCDIQREVLEKPKSSKIKTLQFLASVAV
ncbi:MULTISPECIES: hypothetical protein [unclassified Limnobacter]|mgnify:CR=1 FL=1|uniref:hypothetical protein n=1 Tax=unclassified Limnobacter TaxID=2630203 RepID=UPI0012F18E0F|nr:hypothetical protein [Limnobacter sp. 130]VWX32811.1 conserved hypothetical protein [Limnobacter sp. 130]